MADDHHGHLPETRDWSGRRTDRRPQAPRGHEVTGSAAERRQVPAPWDSVSITEELASFQDIGNWLSPGPTVAGFPVEWVS